MRQTETVQKRELAPEQETCILALLEGVSDEAAGERAGVSRATVQRWKSSDALFIARMNEAQQVQWDTHRARLSALQGRALDVIAGTLDSEDTTAAFKAAVYVLRLSGERPAGPTSETAVALALWSF